ncbi:MAG: sialidase family protein [Chitinophagaceae bacterium]
MVVDHSPVSSGLYLGSPSICILPDGNYVASHDFFGPKGTENQEAITHVFKSTDKGKTWNRIAEIKGQFWSKLFVHRKNIYILGTWKQYGNAIIRKSTDGGVTWTNPTNSANGLLLEGQYHCAPNPVIEHNGRLWRAMEDAMGPIRGWGKMFGSFMMSVPVNADLLDAKNWTFSNSVRYDSTYLNGNFGGWLEGNAVVSPSGGIVNVLRAAYTVNGDEKAAIIKISNDGKQATFNPDKDFIAFPGGSKKFTIRYDKKTKLYWTLSNYVPEKFKGKNFERTRNTQALCSSSDLRNWEVKSIILQHQDMDKHGFQYLDWQFEGKDIIALSRTAYDDAEGGAHNQHDANFITFHRIEDFRKLER